MERLLVGIDVGVSGAIAHIQPFGKVGALSRPMATITPMPILKIRRGKGYRSVYDAVSLSEKISLYRENGWNAHVYIEQPPIPRFLPRAGGSVSQASVAQLHYGFGLIVGMCVAFGLPHTVVSPRTWQAKMLTGVPQGDVKAASIIAAKRIFPNVDLKRTQKCRKDDHNFADALLIAEFGRRQESPLT
jgi:hypothetical protein